MIYEKDKINKIINYCDNIQNEEVKEHLRWITEQYNDYYIMEKEYTERKKEYNRMAKRYYDLEDEKDVLNNRLKIIKNKYFAIRKLYRELKVEYNQSCKNPKDMI